MGDVSNRRVNRSLIDQFVEQNGPDGISVLAVESKVSSATWLKARAGRVPKKFSTRKKMFEFFRTSEDALFPSLADGGEGKAS
jgi:hypothetical protein